MRITLIASEADPYAKVGGLGEIAGVLPRHLAQLGHDVQLILPMYGSIERTLLDAQVVFETMGTPMGDRTLWCRVLSRPDPGGFEVFFIEHEEFFQRKGIYDEYGRGYEDNGERFVFFSRAALQVCIDTGFLPDVVHCHDWMTAIVPAYLKHLLSQDPILSNTGSLLTIHNLGDGYQGRFPSSVFDFSGLPAHAFVSDQFEDHGAINLLKGGISQADQLNAVSPTFAREITEPIGGAGLESFFQRRRHDLHGILNGVDYTHWNPEIDPLIPANYSEDDLGNKRICKEELQREFELALEPDVPLIGIVSRFNYQKGLDLVTEILPELVTHGAQLAILGTGDPTLEHTFAKYSSRFPTSVGCFMGYDNRKAHLIEAGADLFLMPSRWEPCGLNQMYSLRYGTLPIVRATGGLDDTVENYNPMTGDGTGFKFWALNSRALLATAVWALDTYVSRPVHFLTMQRRAMQQRFSWELAAPKYVALYEKAIANRRQRR